jgi:choline dehydrogenase
MRDLVRGDTINALIDAAYAGRLDRRSFVKALVAAGVAAAVAKDMAEHAALAQANQAAQLANLKSEYDYVIVGAGAAGCVMAQRLSQDGRSNVLVIEGGGTNLDQEKISDPRVYLRNFGTDTDWGYKSVPQRHLNNRVIVAPVGKIIGGGSSINATVWLKGDKADYDAWEAAAGPGWGFDAIIRNFKKADRFAGGETAIRGAGMIATRKPAPTHPVTRAFIDSAVGLGKAEHFDINNVASVGNAVGQQDINVTTEMRRISAAHAYLLPALSRSNLTLLANATATKLDLAGGECRGVVATVAGEARRFAAARDVIVCAGGLQSPKLLMLSGIGPADHLRQHGIAVAVDAPRIGANLHDHMLVRLVFSTKGPGAPPQDTGHAGITYHRSSSARGAGPDIQIFGRLNAPNVPNLPSDHGYLTMPGLMKPHSRGTVRLASADPNAPLLVDPNYFAEPADVDTYVTSVELAMAIGNGKGFDAMRKEQVSIPGANRAQIIDYIRANAATYFHFVGTCAMGKDAAAPVDEALRVRGVARLRVADASVMPEIPCCNTHAPTLSLAERAAEIVLASGPVAGAQPSPR